MNLTNLEVNGWYHNQKLSINNYELPNCALPFISLVLIHELPDLIVKDNFGNTKFKNNNI